MHACKGANQPGTPALSAQRGPGWPWLCSRALTAPACIVPHAHARHYRWGELKGRVQAKLKGILGVGGMGNAQSLAECVDPRADARSTTRGRTRTHAHASITQRPPTQHTHGRVCMRRPCHRGVVRNHVARRCHVPAPSTVDQARADCTKQLACPCAGTPAHPCTATSHGRRTRACMHVRVATLVPSHPARPNLPRNRHPTAPARACLPPSSQVLSSACCGCDSTARAAGRRRPTQPPQRRRTSG